MLTTTQVQNLLDAGYEVFTGWIFNNFTATGIVGYREYITYASRDGKVFIAENLV